MGQHHDLYLRNFVIAQERVLKLVGSHGRLRSTDLGVSHAYSDPVLVLRAVPPMTATPMPTVSIIVPAFNAEEWLPRCLDSIVRQTSNDWELIVVDDGSTDTTHSVAEEYTLLDPRVTVLQQENKGPGSARNYAMTRATGDYLAFVDADDFIDLRYVEGICRVAAERPVDIIFLQVAEERADGRPRLVHYVSHYPRLGKSRLLRMQMSGAIDWGACRKVVARSIVVNQGIRFDNSSVGEEIVFNFRALAAAHEIAVLDDHPYYHYLVRSNSQSSGGGLDPWGPALHSLHAALESEGRLAEYQATLGALAMHASLICIRRALRRPLSTAHVRLALQLAARRYMKYGSEIDMGALHPRLHWARPLLPIVRSGALLIRHIKHADTSLDSAEGRSIA